MRVRADLSRIFLCVALHTPCVSVRVWVYVRQCDATSVHVYVCVCVSVFVINLIRDSLKTNFARHAAKGCA